MEHISNLLFWISNGLLVPVIIGLLYFFGKSIIMLESFLSFYVQRQRQEKVIREWIEDLDNQNLPAFHRKMKEQTRTPFTVTVSEVST